MFTVLQIPIIDVRQYIPSNTYRLSKPSWPIPVPDSEFIRQFGIVRERRLGGISAFAGEEIFCHARRAIRLNNEAGIIAENHKSVSLAHKLFLRRIYFEGRSVAKLELGFYTEGHFNELVRKGTDWLNTINAFAEAPCVISPRNAHESISTPLACSGGALSSLYLKSTSSKSINDGQLQPWWVESGEPVILFEYEETKRGRWPAYCKEVPINLPGVNLAYQRVYVSGRKLNIWYIEKSFANKCKWFNSRNLRLHLLRFHAEVQSLKRVLRLISQRKIDIVRSDPATELLQQYLRDTSALISKQTRYGINQQAILDTILNVYDLVSAGERISLLQELSGIRRNILLTVERITRVTNESDSKIYVLGDAQFYEACEIKRGGDVVTNIDIKFGDNTTIHGDFIVAKSIQDSFNTVQASSASREIKNLLEELIKEVTDLSKIMSEADARKIADDLNVFSKEASSPEPRRKWYEISAEGVIDAAKTLGAISNPAISIVKKVLEALG